eukprot:3423484-Pyramimonas_sp.AAC.1
MEISNCMLRVITLWFIFAPAVLSAPFALSWGIHKEAWAQLLASTLEAAGPAFVKWGQWAATRQDLFPKYLCKSLARLQTDAASHSYEHSVKIIERAFGCPVDTLFEKFEYDSLASGSVAQVTSDLYLCLTNVSTTKPPTY